MDEVANEVTNEAVSEAMRIGVDFVPRFVGFVNRLVDTEDARNVLFDRMVGAVADYLHKNGDAGFAVAADAAAMIVAAHACWRCTEAEQESRLNAQVVFMREVARQIRENKTA